MSIKLLEGQIFSRIDGLHTGSGEVIFTTATGRRFHMYHHQSCCENVEVEDVCGDIDDIVGSEITLAEERTQDGGNEYESATWTFYHLRTVRGMVDIRWLGTSNGYYSESVTIAEMEPVIEPHRYHIIRNDLPYLGEGYSGHETTGPVWADLFGSGVVASSNEIRVVEAMLRELTRRNRQANWSVVDTAIGLPQ